MMSRRFFSGAPMCRNAVAAMKVVLGRLATGCDVVGALFHGEGRWRGERRGGGASLETSRCGTCYCGGCGFRWSSQRWNKTAGAPERCLVNSDDVAIWKFAGSSVSKLSQRAFPRRQSGHWYAHELCDNYHPHTFLCHDLPHDFLGNLKGGCVHDLFHSVRLQDDLRLLRKNCRTSTISQKNLYIDEFFNNSHIRSHKP